MSETYIKDTTRKEVVAKQHPIVEQMEKECNKNNMNCF